MQIENKFSLNRACQYKDNNLRPAYTLHNRETMSISLVNKECEMITCKIEFSFRFPFLLLLRIKGAHNAPTPSLFSLTLFPHSQNKVNLQKPYKSSPNWDFFIFYAHTWQSLKLTSKTCCKRIYIYIYVDDFF